MEVGNISLCTMGEAADLSLEQMHNLVSPLSSNMQHIITPLPRCSDVHHTTSDSAEIYRRSSSWLNQSPEEIRRGERT